MSSSSARGHADSESGTRGRLGCKFRLPRLGRKSDVMAHKLEARIGMKMLQSALLGIQKPSEAAVANIPKLVFVIVGLSLSTITYGVLGGVVVVACANL